MSTADAVSRETAWLRASGDSLPALLTTAGGPFEVVQAYRPRSPRQRATGLYVIRRGFREDRFANVRRQAHHQLEVQAIWPLSNQSGSGEAEQQALDDAIQLVLQRVGGLVGDKTHGGRFLSVAEEPRWVEVSFTDPEATMDKRAAFEAQLTYWADDPETIG